jgi:hypothetical protein
MKRKESNCTFPSYYAGGSIHFLTDVSEQPVGPILRLQESRLGPIGCPETSVRNYHYWLRNKPEEGSSHLLRVGTWNQAVMKFCFCQYSFFHAHYVQLIMKDKYFLCFWYNHKFV